MQVWPDLLLPKQNSAVALNRCDRRPPYHTYALLMTGKTPDAISVLIGGEEEDKARCSEENLPLYDQW